MATRKKSPEKVGILRVVITFAVQLVLSHILIQKGGGNWPDDTLATCGPAYSRTIRCHYQPRMPWIDK